MVMFYFSIGLMPCYPVCHFLPTFVHGSFLSTSPVPPPLHIPLVELSATFLLYLPPLPPFRWKTSTADARRCLGSFLSKGYFSKFSTFVSRNFSTSHIFLSLFPNIAMLANLIFLVLENFTNSYRTPPYIDTYLQLFSNFENYGKTLSDKNEPFENSSPVRGTHQSNSK